MVVCIVNSDENVHKKIWMGTCIKTLIAILNDRVRVFKKIGWGREWHKKIYCI